MFFLLENPREGGFVHYFPVRFCTGDACLLGNVVSLVVLFYTDVKSQSNCSWRAPLDVIGAVSLLIVSHFFVYHSPSTVIRGLTEFACLCRFKRGLRKRETTQNITCPLKQNTLCTR